MLGVLVGAGALAVVSRRYRPDPVEVELTRQVTRERRCARELAQLRALGWTVLSDRLLPGTKHRLAHVLVGPAGGSSRRCRPPGWCARTPECCGPAASRWWTGLGPGRGRARPP